MGGFSTISASPVSEGDITLKSVANQEILNQRMDFLSAHCSEKKTPLANFEGLSDSFLYAKRMNQIFGCNGQVIRCPAVLLRGGGGQHINSEGWHVSGGVA